MKQGENDEVLLKVKESTDNNSFVALQDDSPIDTSTDDKKDTDNQLHGDALYHNMYYKDKKYAIRQLKMKNKKWHKLTNYEYTRKIK